MDLRPITPIKNFYLSGVDVLSCGIAGGLASGYVTVGAIIFEKYSRVILHFAALFFGIRLMIFFTHLFGIHLVIMLEGATCGALVSYMKRNAIRKFTYISICVVIVLNILSLINHYVSFGLGVIMGVGTEIMLIKVFKSLRVKQHS